MISVNPGHRGVEKLPCSDELVVCQAALTLTWL